MFDNQPLDSVVTSFSDRHGFEIQIDQKALEAENVTPEQPITIKTIGSLRSVLQRILHPLHLDYVVHEDHLQIANHSLAISKGPVLSYNLAHVVNNSSEGDDIVSTIKKMVHPEEWVDQGRDASCHLIGSVLLVKASEGMHDEIERLLSQLNAMRTDEKNP